MTITQAGPTAAAPGRALGRQPGTRWKTLELLALLQQYAEEFDTYLPRADAHLSERSYDLLELTDDLEIWAIHWPRDKGLQLHDHGGSSGALWVIGGALEEHGVGQHQRLDHRRIEVGGGAAFGPSYIHDVVNADVTPATSLHVYSPPMASLTFYRQEACGLVVERAEYRADPAWAP